MDRPQLQALLESLHRELAQVEEVDDRTRQLLAQVTEDLSRLVEQEEQPPEKEVAESRANLRNAVQEFEAEHPRLAETLGRLADGLANLGI